MKIRPLTKIDVSRYYATHPGVLWLRDRGFHMKFDGRRVFMVHEVVGRIRRFLQNGRTDEQFEEVRADFIACCLGAAFLLITLGALGWAGML